MITAVFNDKMDYTIAYGLWQWDYGQVLRVKGLDFDQISIEVHFSLSPDNTDSLVTIGVVKDVDYQSTIVSDGEEYTVNETATVLDVVIPKDMLWNNIKKNYTIYVFLLSTNEESGETLKRIIMPVKVKPKPIYSVTPKDEELFHRVVEEVNTFAETAKEHSNISKSYAVGNTGTRENEDIDNAKYYAEQSALSAEASEQSASNALVSENHALDSENSALGAESRARTYATEARDLKQEYDNTLALTKEYRDSAQASAISASANLRDTVTARNIATQASADANNFLNQTQAVYDLAVEVKQEVDETKADITAISTEIATTGTEINTVKNEIIAIKSEIDDDKAIIDTKKTAIDNQAIAVADNVAQSNQIKTDIIHLKDDTILIKEETSDIKDATDKIKTDVISIANNINNSISEHNESTTAHSDIRSLISNLTNKLNTFLDTDDESLDQISELITFIQNNRTLIEGITTSKIDKNQGIENASKGLIVGEDGYVTLEDIGYYPVEITSVNSNYQANHTCKEISDAFKNGLIPYAFIHGVEQNIFYLMTCSESLVGFVYLTKDNISIITISQDNTTTVNTNNPIIHTHQDISHKADKATTLSGYGITNAYTKGEVDNIVNNLDVGVTSVNNKTGDVTITAQELGALTEHQDISGKADKSEIPTVPTNVSAFTNDSGYINDLSPYIYYSQNSNTVYINSATETDADDVITINDRITAVENDCYNSYAVDTASGTIASFVDGADDIPLKSLVVDINPVQDLHGYNSPWVAGGGANKVPLFESKTVNGVTLTNNNGEITLNGTATDDAYFDLNVNILIPNGSAYYLCCFNPVATDSRVSLFAITDRGNPQKNMDVVNGMLTSTVTADTTVSRFRLRAPIGVTFTNFKCSPMLQIGGTAPTAFSPYENICPICGWTGCNIQRTGFNVWDEEWEVGAIKTSDGSTTTGDAVRSKNFCQIVPNTTYYVHISSAYLYVFFYDDDKNYVGNSRKGNATFTTPVNARYFKIQVTTTYGNTYNHDISINYPSSDHDYHAYTGQTIPISWESETETGTIYGGKLDVLSGKLTVDRAMVTITEDDEISYASNSNGFLFYCGGKSIGAKNNSAQICNRLRRLQGGSASSIYSAESAFVCYPKGTLYFKVNTSITTVADMKAYLSSAGSLQFCYELEEPIEIQLTPHQVNSLYGANNIFADTGNISTEYRADTTLYINRLTEPDTDMIADANITSGQYFMVGNNLYRATANIASGASVIVGTNAIRKSLSEALNEINA